MWSAFYKIAAAALLAVGAGAAGYGLVADEGGKNCCQQQLACCSAGKACCEATSKTGCCEKGMGCCKADKGCCSAIQHCCAEGKACCDEAKACCGKSQKHDAASQADVTPEAGSQAAPLRQ